jgi:hypothetical protein
MAGRRRIDAIADAFVALAAAPAPEPPPPVGLAKVRRNPSLARRLPTMLPLAATRSVALSWISREPVAVRGVRPEKVAVAASKVSQVGSAEPSASVAR